MVLLEEPRVAHRVRRGPLFACALGALFGMVLAPTWLAVLSGGFINEPLGSVILDLLILALSAVCGLAAGLISAGAAHIVIAATHQRNSLLGAALMLLISFAIGSLLGALFSYGLGSPSDSAIAQSLGPAGVGAAAVTACWITCHRRPRPRVEHLQ